MMDKREYDELNDMRTHLRKLLRNIQEFSEDIGSNTTFAEYKTFGAEMDDLKNKLKARIKAIDDAVYEYERDEYLRFGISRMREIMSNLNRTQRAGLQSEVAFSTVDDTDELITKLSSVLEAREQARNGH